MSYHIHYSHLPKRLQTKYLQGVQPGLLAVLQQNRIRFYGKDKFVLPRDGMVIGGSEVIC